MLRTDCRKDSDDHHVSPDRAGLFLSAVEAGTGVSFELVEYLVAEQPRRYVDLDVELPELGLEVWVGDRLQHGGVHHRRLAAVVGQIQLDLEPNRAARGLEPGLRQHSSEHVKTRANLPAIALAVFSREGLRGDLLAHGVLKPTVPGARGNQQQGSNAALSPGSSSPLRRTSPLRTRVPARRQVAVSSRLIDEALLARPVDGATERLCERRIGEPELARGARAVVPVAVQDRAHARAAH